ncbi:MAG: FKBP-type peptidyl-prolyl cis-trans isomerase [Crocinitomicaceae bacterium]|nr:FKBP-type peptidyl-prolyl cis-trans isomerase [Crocinitomicaceae bacterium]
MKDFRDSTEAMDQEEARNFIIDEMTFQAKKKGSDFLEANKTKQGINVTPSGLQYEVLTEGTGMVPDADDSVTVHYSGTLIDGKVFDSSIERGEPVTFILSQVIPGWSEGLQLMHEGSKYKLYIPQELGYGARPPGGIPPYSPLIFEVELIRVKKNDGVAGEPGLGEIEHK